MNSTKEIDLVVLFIELIRKWYVIIFAAILGASILAGFVGARKHVSVVADTTKQETSLAEKVKKQDSLKEEIRQCNVELDNYEQKLSDEKKNLVNPFDADPKHMYVAEKVFFISTHLAMTEATQNHITNSIKMISTSIKEVIDNQISYRLATENGVDVAYMKMMLSCSSNYQVVTVYAEGKNAEDAKKLLNSLDEYLVEVFGDWETKLPDYSIEQMTEICYETQNDALAELVERNETNRQLYTEEISKREFKLLSLNEELSMIQKDIDSLENEIAIAISKNNDAVGTSIRDVVKNAIIGFVLGGFIVIATMGMYIIFRGKVYSTRDINNVLGMEFLGDISFEDKKGFNRLLGKIEGNAVNRTGNNEISILLESIQSRKDASLEKTLFVGLCDEMDLKKCTDCLSQSTEKVDIYAECNVLDDFRSFKIFADMEEIVIIIKVGKTTHKECNRLLEKCKAMNKRVIGCIAVE